MEGLLKRFSALSVNAVRHYAFKSDLKIKWVHVKKTPCYTTEKSGDVGGLPSLKPDEFLKGYNQSEELKTANDYVKSLFMLRNHKQVETTRFQVYEIAKTVQRHPQDFGSMETRVAMQTGLIRCWQKKMEAHPRNKTLKRRLKELIEKRKKFLKKLRNMDYARYEWLLEKLDLVYKAHPDTGYQRVTRKESLTKLTHLHCEGLIQEKLKAYAKELHAQKIPFLEDEIKTLEYVRSEQINCGMAVTVTQEQIDASKKELDVLKRERDEVLVTASQKKKEEDFY